MPHLNLQATHPCAHPAPCLPRAPHGPSVSWRSAMSRGPRGFSYARELIKLAARAAVNRAATRQWIAYWNSSPFLVQLALRHPAVLKKIYRPYLFAQFSCRQRLAALVFHYNFIMERHLGKLVAHAAQAQVDLAQWSGKSGLHYQLGLVAINTMEREGELVLQLVCEGVILYSVALTFMSTGNSTVIALGCLQGGRADDAMATIRVATRDMFGLRPKSLMVRAVQQIGLAFQCSALLLVGNANRVMHQQIRKGRVVADYDSTWREMGATPQVDGNFHLPCVALTAPDLAGIASSKRSEARKRHALLLAVTGAVNASLCEAYDGAAFSAR